MLVYPTWMELPIPLQWRRSRVPIFCCRGSPVVTMASQRSRRWWRRGIAPPCGARRAWAASRWSFRAEVPMRGELWVGDVCWLNPEKNPVDSEMATINYRIRLYEKEWISLPPRYPCKPKACACKVSQWPNSFTGAALIFHRLRFTAGAARRTRLPYAFALAKLSTWMRPMSS